MCKTDSEVVYMIMQKVALQLQGMDKVAQDQPAELLSLIRHYCLCNEFTNGLLLFI